jgi:isopenicillin N synthase-like dioxygenase
LREGSVILQDAGLPIPVIDLGYGEHGGYADKPELIQTCGEALTGIGCVQILNHGIPGSLMQAMLKETRGFFSRSLEEKLRLSPQPYNPQNSNRYRGYFPTKLNANTFSEGLNVGPEYRSAPDNLPGRLTGYYETVPWSRDEDAKLPDLIHMYHHRLSQLSSYLMRLVAQYMGLSRDAFDQYFVDHISTLRLLHYPLREMRPQQEFAVPAQIGAGTLTLLQQDGAGGLEVEIGGDWFPVEPIADAFVVNIGQLLTYWTNQAFQATPYRIRALKETGLCLPFSYEPAPTAEIVPIDNKSDDHLLYETCLADVSAPKGRLV